MSPGLYMRDVAEVRGGSDSFDFKKNSNPPIDPDHCLSLIGSERTISLELPGKVRQPMYKTPHWHCPLKAKSFIWLIEFPQIQYCFLQNPLKLYISISYYSLDGERLVSREIPTDSI